MHITHQQWEKTSHNVTTPYISLLCELWSVLRQIACREMGQIAKITFIHGWFVTKENIYNKANLRDLIAAIGLVILLKLDSNHRFFSRETPNLAQNRRFFSRVTLKFDGWASETIEHLFYATSSFEQHFIAIGEFKLELQSRNAQSRSKSPFFLPCDLEIWLMTFKNNRAPLLCYFKLCASFRSHWWIQTGVTVRKRPIWVKIDDFFSHVTLKFDEWPSKTIGHLS